MKTLFLGGSKSGKSNLAEKLALQISEQKKCDIYYIATMRAQDEEDKNRIATHQKNRIGKNFITVEWDGKTAFPALPKQSVILLDSCTALFTNLCFDFFEGEWNFFCGAGESTILLLQKILNRFCNVIFVSDYIFSSCFANGANFSSVQNGLSANTVIPATKKDFTADWAFLYAKVLRFLSENCDTVVEVQNGIPLVKKGAYAFPKDFFSPPSPKKWTLIFGGIAQGKTEFAKKQFSISQDEIFVCTRFSPPDFSAKCFSHLEEYVYFCTKENVPLKTDFPQGTIFIATNIQCGIVPQDPFERLWREETGRYLQALAKCSSVVRVFCGIAEVIF